jgi:2-polyprenyl-3-methyl-5-hydroxy-6-metoxy-1,4-benzoquinol methylase
VNSSPENNTEAEEQNICWVCGSSNLAFYKASDIENELTAQDFAITDSDYGRTGELHQCASCGFIQSEALSDVLSFYENLEDAEYETGRSERGLQARKLLDLLPGARKDERLVDVGAGSGILVEQALGMGYLAEGVEPSRWLREQAVAHKLPVHLGVFPHPDIEPGVDVVTMVDVIEHVSNPVELLTAACQCMGDDAVGLIVTPDVDSLAARFLGKRWWHFRIAHIGYFNKRNLLLALQRAGLESVKVGRPTWYFTVGYLWERVMHYMPSALRFSLPRMCQNWIVPLNLADSIYVIFRKA